MAVSALNSLLWKIGDSNDKQRKLDYLNMKYNLLKELGLTKQSDEVMAEIMRLDPTNTTLKLDCIKKYFAQGDVFKAFTEYMRFEALVELKQH